MRLHHHPLEIHFQVEGHRKWLPLLGFAALPLVFGILRAAFRRDAPRATDNPPAYVPELGAAIATPVPSAPLEDNESIPLVAAHTVETIPEYTKS